MSTETANATTTEKKMYTLRSSDKESFEVEESVAMMSSTIKHLIEDGCSDNGIPLPNVSASILAKVIEYCQKHAPVESPTKKTDDDKDDSSGVAVVGGGADAAKDDLKQWDKDFINVDKKTLMEIILAANYLDIKSLLELTCQTVADKIKNMMPEEVRKFLNIENDFTPDEEEAVRNENPWAFESDK